MFGQPFVPPVSDGSGQDRALLRKASQLLQDAGLPMKDGKRMLPNGEVFTIEFLLDEPSLLPHHSTLHQESRFAWHRCQPAVVDAVQYRARVENPSIST